MINYFMDLKVLLLMNILAVGMAGVLAWITCLALEYSMKKVAAWKHNLAVVHHRSITNVR